jgi:hypothetical protein
VLLAIVEQCFAWPKNYYNRRRVTEKARLEPSSEMGSETMRQLGEEPSIVRRFVYGGVLLLIPTLAVLFLSAGSPPFAEVGFCAQAFAPLSNSKKAPVVAKAPEDVDRVPEVKLDVWEYTGAPISNPR